MKTTKIFSFIFLLMLSSVTFAQDELQITAKDSIVKSSWIFGVGLNAVDDSGNVFDGGQIVSGIHHQVLKLWESTQLGVYDRFRKF